MSELERLLGEIRSDSRWRQEVDALRRPGTDTEAVSDEDASDVTSGVTAPVAPPPDEALVAALENLAHAIVAADVEPPIAPGRPMIGDLWARVRELLRREIAVYREQQRAVNRQLASSSRLLGGALDAGEPGSALGAVWTELTALSLRIQGMETRLAGVERLAGATRHRITSFEQSVPGLLLEIEPMGDLRATVADLESRLETLERGAPG